MRKTTVIAAVAAGFVGWCSVGNVARAQAPEPEPPAQPDAPVQPEAAPDALPPGAEPPPAEPSAPEGEPSDSPPRAPLDNTLFPNPALDARGLQPQGQERP